MSSTIAHDDQSAWLKKFLTIWTGQSLSLLSSAVTNFALIWWLAKETDSAQVLATVAIFTLAPDIVVLPLVGTVVDHWDRRRIMLLADGSMMALTLGLAVLFATDSMTLPHIYFYQLATSVGQVFQRTAMVAVTQQLVPLCAISRMQGLNTFLWGASRLLVPPLAALLLTVLNLEAILLIDVATAFFAIAPLLFLHLPSLKVEAQPSGSEWDKKEFWRDILGGAIYLARHRGLLALLVCVALGGLLLTPMVIYLPLLVKNHFAGGARELAWIESAFGGGIICGGALLGLRKTTDKQVIIMLVSMIGIGIGYGVLVLLANTLFFWALPIMLAIGILCALASAPTNTIFQTRVPAEYLGRVWVIYGLLSNIFSPVGLAISAMLVDGLGVRGIMLVCALLYGGCAAVGFFIPVLRALDYEEKGAST